MTETRKVQLTVIIEVEDDVSADEVADVVLETLGDELHFAHSVEVGPAMTVSPPGPRRGGLRLRLRFK